MAGTFATFAGIACFAAEFNRSRGWQADVSTVEVPLAKLPAGIELAPAVAIGARPKSEGTRTRGAADGGAGQVPVAKAVPFEGFLILSESVNGEEWSVTIGPLFVVRAEAVRTPDASDVLRVKLTLVDERYFWPRGVCSRWSFNRRRGDGTIAADSVKPGLVPFTREEVARLTALSLFRGPALTALPAAWTTDKSAVEFEPFAPAVLALTALVTKAGLEDPVLRLDGTLALHKAGEGRVGYAPGGRGENAQPFPPQVRLYKNGGGQGVTTENAYPEEFVLVVGGERIASVALDSWVPVLVLPDQDTEGRSTTVVAPLTEERVRFLTNGRYGLEWLHRFILQPNAYQSVAGVSNDLLDIFRTQPYRFFQCPGAVLETKTEKAGARDFGAVYEPGPNAHLLPLLDRAETSAGKRLPVLVEASRFTTVHQALRGTPAQIRMATVLRLISALRANAPTRERKVSLGDAGTRPITVEDVFAGSQLRASGRGVSLEDLQRALDKAREVDSYRGSTRGDVFADELDKLNLQMLQAEEDLGADPGRTEMYEIAKEILAEEKKLKEATNVTDALDGNDVRKLLNAGSVREALLGRLSEKLEKIQRDRQAQKDRERVGGASEDEAAGMVLLQNMPRGAVSGRVFSAEQGVIQTDEMCVHVEIDPAAFKPGDRFPAIPSSPAHARAVPCPVRVTFGAVVRPRTDRPWAPTSRPRTGVAEPAGRRPGETLGAFQERRRRELAEQVAAVTPEPGETPEAFLARRGRDCPPEPDVIPEALTDPETYYTAAFKRVGRGKAASIPLASVPMDQAVRLGEPDLVELVTVHGDSNRLDLDEQAERLALERFGVPDQVKTERVTLARPWPVNCDGLVSTVNIAMRFKDGAPCGYETSLTVGGSPGPAGGGPTRTRARRGDGARREGART